MPLSWEDSTAFPKDRAVSSIFTTEFAFYTHLLKKSNADPKTAGYTFSPDFPLHGSRRNLITITKYICGPYVAAWTSTLEKQSLYLPKKGNHNVWLCGGRVKLGTVQM